MTNSDANGSAAFKRRKIHHDDNPDAETSIATSTSTVKGVDRPISPPLLRRARRNAQDDCIKSPIHLTRIRDMPSSKNIDTISLSDILGDASITACWCFNFLLDVDFITRHFHPENKEAVHLHIVHGFWKRDDARRISLHEAAKRYENVRLHQAWLPDAFGTHHSKMMVLVREGSVQVVIHTANMIERDWANMTQGVWMSPMLPLAIKKKDVSSLDQEHVDVVEKYPIGSGERFKVDLLRYLGAYGKRLDELTTHVTDYDFSSVRAAFLSSVPSRQKREDANPTKHTSFGWLGLKEILSSIPIKHQTEISSKPSKPNIVIQVSSIATLGPTPTWLQNFQSVLTHSRPKTSSALTKASSLLPQTTKTKPKPTFNIIFPTPSEIRTSIDGYSSGHSIHMKLHAPQAQKQWTYLKDLFCHWKRSTSIPTPTWTMGVQKSRSILEGNAHRGPAAPHIKTYIRFSDEARRTVDWAMLTSANLSRQAWGDLGWGAEGEGGEVSGGRKEEKSVWIQSYEVGVVVWPGLFVQEGDGEGVMVPCFGRDTVVDKSVDEGGGDGGLRWDDSAETEDEDDDQPLQTRARVHSSIRKIIPLRMPYDIPLSPYTADEIPWCASAACEEVDWKGRVWEGY